MISIAFNWRSRLNAWSSYRCRLFRICSPKSGTVESRREVASMEDLKYWTRSINLPIYLVSFYFIFVLFTKFTLSCVSYGIFAPFFMFERKNTKLTKNVSEKFDLATECFFVIYCCCIYIYKGNVQLNLQKLNISPNKQMKIA